MGDEGPVRVLVTEQRVGASGEPTLHDLSDALTAVYGTDYGVHSPTSISRFTDVTRQAASYRDRRVLLAGDAAHVHYPVGGQGLNIGVQDAVNLGWKLAQVVNGTSPDSVLDTYHVERHPVAARVLRDTMAQTALLRSDDRIDALRDIMSELLSMDEPRKRFAGMMSGLDIHYELGEGHPLPGRRMPDLDLVTANGPLRVFTLLHDARPVPQPRRGPGIRHHSLGRSGAGNRGRIRWSVGASGTRSGGCSQRGVDSARRVRGLGGRRNPAGAVRRADHWFGSPTGA
jgi:3-(3-hydroxy-phenyl)propionate hydroxylase